MAKSVEEQAKELKEHRDELTKSGLGFFFLITYGTILAAFQDAIKHILKNKDGTDANLSWDENLVFVLKGWDRACNMHKYDEKVDPKAFTTDWYELTREEYRMQNLVLGYSDDADKIFLKVAKGYFDATGGKVKRDEEEKED